MFKRRAGLIGLVSNVILLQVQLHSYTTKKLYKAVLSLKQNCVHLLCGP